MQAITHTQRSDHTWKVIYIWAAPHRYTTAHTRDSSHLGAQTIVPCVISLGRRTNKETSRAWSRGGEFSLACPDICWVVNRQVPKGNLQGLHDPAICEQRHTMTLVRKMRGVISQLLAIITTYCHVDPKGNLQGLHALGICE